MDTNKYYVITLITNTQGQDAPSATVFTGETDNEAKRRAETSYFGTLSALANASDVLYAVCQIENFEGTIIAEYVINNVEADEN